LRSQSITNKPSHNTPKRLTTFPLSAIPYNIEQGVGSWALRVFLYLNLIRSRVHFLQGFFQFIRATPALPDWEVAWFFKNQSAICWRDLFSRNPSSGSNTDHMKLLDEACRLFKGTAASIHIAIRLHRVEVKHL